MRRIGICPSANVQDCHSALAAVREYWDNTFTNTEFDNVVICDWNFKDEDEFNTVKAITDSFGVKWRDEGEIQTKGRKEKVAKSERLTKKESVRILDVFGVKSETRKSAVNTI